jgi:hypothetical protein
MNYLILLLLASISFTAQAGNLSEDEVLTVDEPIPGSVHLEFADTDDLVPKFSDFEIISSLYMSSESGERWAILTIRNRSASQRLFDNEHIVALFANGEKRYPTNTDHTFYGKEQITMTINFGKSKFPIIRVDVRNR